MRSLVLAVLLLATAVSSAGASAAPRLQPFDSGRYAALAGDGSLSFVVSRSQITGLRVRMPLVCENTRTHKQTAPTLAFAASRTTTYSRIYLPASGSANVSFVVDDNSRQPEIYLSLQLRGGTGHASLHALSTGGHETCSGAVGFDVRVHS